MNSVRDASSQQLRIDSSLDCFLVSKFGPCPKAGDGVHSWQNSVVCSLLKTGHSDQETYLVAKRLTARCGRNTDQDIRESINTAHRNLDLGDGKVPRLWIKKQRGVPNKSAAEAVAALAPHVDEDWLVEHSPIATQISPGEFLQHISRPNDAFIIFTNQKSQGQTVWRRGYSLNRFIKGQQEGVWFLANPVSGRSQWTDRLGKESRRSEECLTGFHHLVLESDSVPVCMWLRILVQLPLPIVSITLSGRRSAHALARISATSKDEFTSIRERLIPRLATLGADPAAMTAVRLTRLPNCFRGDHAQSLLWINPEADGRSILEITV